MVAYQDPAETAIILATGGVSFSQRWSIVVDDQLVLLCDTRTEASDLAQRLAARASGRRAPRNRKASAG
jgi:hypothetical protein